MFFDLLIISSIFYAGTAGRIDPLLNHILILSVVSLAVILIFYLTGVYHHPWKYLNLFLIGSAVLWPPAIIALTAYLQNGQFIEIGGRIFNITVYISFALILHRFLVFYRLNPESRRRKHGEIPIIIYGAGTVGMRLLQDLNTEDATGKYNITAFVDNDPEKSGNRVGPYKVYHGSELTEIVRNTQAREIWFTMPVTPAFTESILKDLKDFSITYKVVPRKLAHLLPDIRTLRIEDLIERPEIKLSSEPLHELLSGKRVLITGAAGSIGREIARQVAAYGPVRTVLLDQYEYGIYSLQKEFETSPVTQCIIGDIRNRNTMLRLFNTEKPQIIFHAAAYKHVPLLETDYREAIENNILGTFNLMQSAAGYLTGNNEEEYLQIVNISTDKAVEPKNMMGLSKRISELVVYNYSADPELNADGRLKSVSVRFGNVLGSSGSVVPLFWQQISNGGPVTVTHPEMERFFMTIPEAVHLVLHALNESKGHDILALDMGTPVKITALAERLIMLAGKTPGRDIEITYTGIRPGEKLKEELFWEKGSVKTDNPYIFRSEDDLKEVDLINLLGLVTESLREKHSLNWYKKFLDGYV